jgi:3-methyladenine DNA glycosylase AlkD
LIVAQASDTAARIEDATSLGGRLGDMIGDPEAVAAELNAGFRALADPAHRAGQLSVAPGIGPVLGVRMPVMSAAANGLKAATRGVSPTLLLFVADRLLRDELLEAHWFAFRILDRTVAVQPEGSWQLLRRAARGAADWITVDALAHPVGRGILAEPFRWAEAEQLVYSPSRWERRLVGSTLATIPFIDRLAGRTPEYVARSLPILGDLIGDAEPDVQKALAWAYRSAARFQGLELGQPLPEPPLR